MSLLSWRRVGAPFFVNYQQFAWLSEMSDIFLRVELAYPRGQGTEIDYWKRIILTTYKKFESIYLRPTKPEDTNETINP